MKKNLAILMLLFAACFITAAGTTEKKQKRILVFSKTAGYRHGSIEAGKAALLKMGAENNWRVDTTEDAAYFTDHQLKKYAAVVFLNTTGNVLNEAQQSAFEKYIRSGKGFAGIHAATDTEYEWPWFCKLVGANFASHPKQQNAVLHVTDSTHASTKHLPHSWPRFDEWYNFKNQNPAVNTLLTIDEKSYEGGTNGAVHPMAWYHEYDGGKAFYTALGHTDASYSEANFLQHVLGGLQYVMGKK
jgi:uncharacterized protein